MKQKLPLPSGEIVAAYAMRHHKTQTPLGTMGKSLLNMATSWGPHQALGSSSHTEGRQWSTKEPLGPAWGKMRWHATWKISKPNQLNLQEASEIKPLCKMLLQRVLLLCELAGLLASFVGKVEVLFAAFSFACLYYPLKTKCTKILFDSLNRQQFLSQNNKHFVSEKTRFFHPPFLLGSLLHHKLLALWNKYYFFTRSEI